MDQKLKVSAPGWRSLLWALALVAVGTALGFGLNAASPVGINLHIALGLDDPAPAAPAATVKP
jgi:cytochrome c oxidase assembly factor CtaG